MSWPSTRVNRSPTCTPDAAAAPSPEQFGFSSVAFSASSRLTGEHTSSAATGSSFCSAVDGSPKLIATEKMISTPRIRLTRMPANMTNNRCHAGRSIIRYGSSSSVHGSLTVIPAMSQKPPSGMAFNPYSV